MIRRILVMPAPAGPDDWQMQLAGHAMRLFGERDVAATLISLDDYALPVASSEADAPVPANARLLAQRLAANDALLVVTGERHALPAPALLNALEWIGRAQGADERPLRPFAGLIAGLAGVAEGESGDLALACQTLRTTLRARGAEVVGSECRLEAGAVEGEAGLTRPGAEARLAEMVERLIDHARSLGRHA